MEKIRNWAEGRSVARQSESGRRIKIDSTMKQKIKIFVITCYLCNFIYSLQSRRFLRTLVGNRVRPPFWKGARGGSDLPQKGWR